MNEDKLTWVRKDHPYGLRTIDQTKISYDDGMVTKETVQLSVVINVSTETLSFEITDTGKHDIVLGLPWFQKHNPDIDWITGQLRWRQRIPEGLQSTDTIKEVDL